MCNSGVHRPYSGVVDPFPFSTFHFLRTCNRLIVPTDLTPYYGLVKDTVITDSSADNNNNKSSHSYHNAEGHCSEIASLFTSPFVKDPSQVNAAVTRIPCSTPPVNVVDTSVDYPLVASSRANSLSYSSLLHRRQRGEKRPIPEEQKDEKYYERRKRNNEAAKKSRDARKLREDRIAFRAAILEQENAILRAQIVALRDEMTTLRQVMAARPPQISVNI